MERVLEEVMGELSGTILALAMEVLENTWEDNFDTPIAHNHIYTEEAKEELQVIYDDVQKFAVIEYIRQPNASPVELRKYIFKHYPAGTHR